RYARLNQTLSELQVFLDSEKDLWPDYHLTRRSMRSLIDITNWQQCQGWDITEILIFVYWLAHGFSNRVTPQAFSVPHSTVCCVLHNIAWNIKDKLDDIGLGFECLAHAAVNKAVCAIDGCHICMKPQKRKKEDYLSYKQFFSIQTQAICDSSGCSLNIFVRYSGSVNDTRIFKNSQAYVNAEYPPPGFVLLHDGGYPCKQKENGSPYTLQAAPSKKDTSHCHSLACTILEWAFRMIKTQWRRTLFKDFGGAEITACAFLHNI
uniref:DDE Tnp4 domain-containing protein n=1 Tax=Lepisosteus oculatus TaxID=7918 RepID=W5MWP4_LEPOC